MGFQIDMFQLLLYKKCNLLLQHCCDNGIVSLGTTAFVFFDVEI